ncbi:MAG: hypothetical protein RKE49_00315 [Oceanicaulis sp.]
MSRSDQVDESEDGLEFIDAAFDAELAAMFEAAAPSERDPAFTERVMARTARTDRYRFLALGAAGALGALVAGSQLPGLLDFAGGQAGAGLGAAADFAGPEALVTLLFAGLALAFSRVLSGGRAV